MANIRFNLKEPYKNGQCAINVVLQFNHLKLKYATGLTIDPQLWDKASQRIKKNKTIPYIEFNQQLQTIETETERAFLRLKNEKGRTPSVTELRTELDTITDRNQEKPVTLFEFLESRIKELTTERKSEATAKKHHTVLMFLKEFAKLQHKRSFEFADINELFFIRFKNFCYEVKGHNPNTLQKNVETLKTAMREARKRKHHTNTDFDSFTVKKVPTHDIYLNENELEKIYKLDLSDKIGHDTTRDLFIIGCFTGGQRFSDWAKLKPENMFTKNGVQYLKFVSDKTEIETVAPLNHAYVQAILEKHNGILPKPLSNQRSNKYLKDIGTMAGIDTPTKDITYPKGIRTEETVPKYDLITTHTARRSLATNMVNAQYTLHQIRLLTGHKTEKMLQEYLKTSSYENALKMADTPFYDNTQTE